MSGATDLEWMLASLEPVLDPRRFCFVSFAHMPLAEAEAFDPIALFRESEGLSVVAEDKMLLGHIASDTPRFSMISITVHSSLESVGLTAALSAALAEAGISANVIAATFHDHVFVPEARSADAMAVLKALSRS